MSRLRVRVRSVLFVAMTVVAALSLQAGQRWFH